MVKPFARLLALLMMWCVCMGTPAQKSKSGAAAPAKKTATPAKKPAAPAKKPATPAKKTTTPAKKPAAKQPANQREKLQAEQKKLKQNIAANQRQKAELDKRVKQQLQDVLILGSAIDEQKKVLDTIKTDIAQLDSSLAVLNTQLGGLKKQLADRQERYAQSVRYMHHNRKMQSKMMFVFSAKNVNQMYRRTRFMNEYATYQKVQGEAVKQKQRQVDLKLQEIQEQKSRKDTLLAKGVKEQQSLESQQARQQEVARQLQKEQKTVQALIQKQQKEENALNQQIEKLIAEEVAREKARLEAEKKRKAEEQARKERERKRKLDEAKAREEQARKAAREAKTAKEKADAKQSLKKAENERKAAEKVVAESRKSTPAQQSGGHTYEADPDRKLTGSFASNKGKLPMPITGNYQVVRGFGSNVVDGAGNGVHLTSKGIYLKGQPGAQARCVFDGQVSKIFANGSSYIVMVRHGKYISVYCDLASVSVSAGQKVSTNQTLGKLGPSNTMQFQLRNWTDLLNPRSWLRR